MYRQVSPFIDKMLNTSGIVDITDPKMFHYGIWKSVLRFLINIFHADSAVFHMRDLDNLHFLDSHYMASLNIDSRFPEEYINYYHKIDFHLKVLPGPYAYRDNDIVSYDDFKRHEVYTDFMKYQKMKRTLIIYLHHGGYLLGHIAICKNDIIPFSSDDLIKARCIGRILSSKFARGQSVKELILKEKLLKRISDLSSEGIIVLNSKLCPLYWNSKAEEIGLSLSENNEITRCVRSGLVLPIKVSRESLKINKSNTFCQKDVLKSDDNCRVLYTGRNSGLETRLEIFFGKPGYALTPDSCLFLFIFHKIPESNYIPTPVIPNNWEFTSRENEIVQLINQGLTYNEICNKIFITSNTMSTHVKHIFTKVGVGSRARLIHKLQSELA